MMDRDKYFDIEKNTIMEMLRSNIDGITITDDNLVDYSKITRFACLDDGLETGSIHICDYENYVNYGKVVFVDMDLRYMTLEHIDTGETRVIVGYNQINGEIVLDKTFGFKISDKDELEVSATKNDVRVEVMSIYNFDKIIGLNRVQSYRRFDIKLYVGKDRFTDKSNYYMNIIKSIFNNRKSHKMIDEQGNYVDSLIYIEDPINFGSPVGDYRDDEFNIKGKITISSYQKNK